MKTFQQIQDEDRLLSLLLFLEQLGDYTGNEFLIHTALESVAHRVSRDRVRADFAWLAEQGLVTVSELGDVLIAKLTDRGLDVAQARVTHPGVKRPRP